MLCAYYGCGWETRDLFSGLMISTDTSFDAHLNNYNSLFLNMQEFFSSTGLIEEMVSLILELTLKDAKEDFEGIEIYNKTRIEQVMRDIFKHTGRRFVVVIDEWDCMFREYKDDLESQKRYLDFLRLWLKDKEYIALAYMTGILPIKNYGTHIALNMFAEYPMLQPRRFAPYFGL